MISKIGPVRFETGMARPGLTDNVLKTVIEILGVERAPERGPGTPPPDGRRECGRPVNFLCYRLLSSLWIYFEHLQAFKEELSSRSFNGRMVFCKLSPFGGAPTFDMIQTALSSLKLKLKHRALFHTSLIR